MAVRFADGQPVADWIVSLEADAPDVTATWRALEPTRAGVKAMRRELRARAVDGSAPRILVQQEAVGDALETVLRQLPDRLLRAPGGEEDWNVAQAFAHATAARRFLATWAADDAGVEAAGEPGGPPPVVTPSVPGRADASRDELLTLLDKSRRAVRAAAARIEGHERQRCWIEHPLLGALRCGEWLLWIGVHDCAHLEQLHRLRHADPAARG